MSRPRGLTEAQADSLRIVVGWHRWGGPSYLHTVDEAHRDSDLWSNTEVSMALESLASLGFDLDEISDVDPDLRVELVRALIAAHRSGAIITADSLLTTAGAVLAAEEYPAFIPGQQVLAVAA